MSEHHAWLQTAGGRVVDALDTAPEGIEIADIAAGLSNAPRYAGQTVGFYSVAMHSVRMSALLYHGDAAAESEDNYAARWALLHDASEAYLCDLPTPVKYELPDYRRLETRLQNRILKRFGLGLVMPLEVQEADARMLATEVRDLLVAHSLVWGLLREAYEFHVAFHSPAEARYAFEQQARLLGLWTDGTATEGTAENGEGRHG